MSRISFTGHVHGLLANEKKGKLHRMVITIQLLCVDGYWVLKLEVPLMNESSQSITSTVALIAEMENYGSSTSYLAYSVEKLVIMKELVKKKKNKTF